MTREVHEPERLRDVELPEGGPRTPEERASELVKMVGEPVLPSRQELRAAKPRFAGVDRGVRWGWAWRTAAVLGVLLGTTGIVAAARGVWFARPRPITVEVPLGSTSHITAPGGARLHLVGPGSLESTAPRFVLHGGTVIAEAGKEPLALAVGDLGITVAAGGSAKMTTEAGNTRVENLAGDVFFQQGNVKQAIPTGQSWYNGLVTASLGQGSDAPRAPAVFDLVAPLPPMDPGDALAVVPLGPPERPGDHAESHLLGVALRKLRKEGDPRGALELFDQHEKRFPNGRLGPEARLGRAEALMALGRRAEALAVLDASSDLRRPTRVLRGELRAGLGRCADALTDFAASLSADPHDSIDDRALFGRAFCRAETGDKAGARADLSLYEARFPSGQFILQVKRSLAGQ
jgi:hypothetical protein